MRAMLFLDTTDYFSDTTQLVSGGEFPATPLPFAAPPVFIR
jgi:hypothetical protein